MCVLIHSYPRLHACGPHTKCIATYCEFADANHMYTSPATGGLHFENSKLQELVGACLCPCDLYTPVTVSQTARGVGRHCDSIWWFEWPLNLRARAFTQNTARAVPARARRWNSVVLMLVQRLRRWPNIKTTLVQRLVFAGVGPPTWHWAITSSVTSYRCSPEGWSVIMVM